MPGYRVGERKREQKRGRAEGGGGGTATAKSYRRGQTVMLEHTPSLAGFTGDNFDVIKAPVVCRPVSVTVPGFTHCHT